MGDGKWNVRGVPEDLTKAASRAAKARGITLGRLVTDALLAHLKTLERAENPQESSPPAIQLTDILRRLEALEALILPSDTGRQSDRDIKKPGVPRNRRDLFDRVVELTASGTPRNEIAQALDVGRSTVYRYVDIAKEEGLLPS